MIDTHTLSKTKQSFTSKFAPKRDGPHVICRVVSPTTFEVSNIDKPEIPLGKYHISALTPYHGTEGHVPMPLRRRGRPPKLTSKPSVNVSNSVSNDSPAEVSQPSAQKIGNTPPGNLIYFEHPNLNHLVVLNPARDVREIQRWRL
ncbi:hypothetical protein NQ314_018298 [Rhamnusium bicolor]|uniref:Uncharacterized protein n=1 Tax=Rhamnusium bicolor TaxID=1586634 RepID=A0AAV8WS39_9CUCU|nr:hypothetical protein NQ314_018298 [Rhamnusium bicolor]